MSGVCGWAVGCEFLTVHPLTRTPHPSTRPSLPLSPCCSRGWARCCCACWARWAPRSTSCVHLLRWRPGSSPSVPGAATAAPLPLPVSDRAAFGWGLGGGVGRKVGPASSPWRCDNGYIKPHPPASTPTCPARRRLLRLAAPGRRHIGAAGCADCIAVPPGGHIWGWSDKGGLGRVWVGWARVGCERLCALASPAAAQARCYTGPQSPGSSARSPAPLPRVSLLPTLTPLMLLLINPPPTPAAAGAS